MLKDLIRDIHKHRDEEFNLPSEIDLFILSRNEDDSYHRYGWHPSTLCKFCPRERILREEEGLEEEEIEPRVRRLFDLGTDVHYRYQNSYLGPMKILWGLWECNRCSKRMWGFYPKWCECGFRKKRWIYKEVPVEYHKEGLAEPYVGKSDGVLRYNNVWYVLDIKTSREDMYNFTRKPSTGYSDQIHIYGNLIRNGHLKSKFRKEIPVTKGILLYYNKNDSNHKAFPFDLDFDRGEEMMGRAEIYETAKKEEKLPDRLEECTKKSDTRARKCKMKIPCFERK